MRLRPYVLSALRSMAVAALILLGLVYLGARIVGAQTETPRTPQSGFQESGESLTLVLTPELVGNGQIVAEDDKVVWQYVGPENTKELEFQCNDLNWSQLEVKARQIVAEAQKEDGRIVRASAKVDLPAGATNDMHYCFRTPILIGEEVIHYYRLHTLTSAAAPSYNYFIFEKSVPLEGTDIPASVSLRPNPEMIEGIQAIGWEYVAVANPEECNPDSSQLDFSALEIAVDTLKPRLVLTTEMAGQSLCFRFIGEDSVGERVYFYDAYTVPSPAAEAGDEGDSARVWLIIGGIVAALGLTVLIITRSK